MADRIESSRDLNVYRLAMELQQEKCERIGKMLGRMMSKPDRFCGGRTTNRRHETH